MARGRKASAAGGGEFSKSCAPFERQTHMYIYIYIYISASPQSPHGQLSLQFDGCRSPEEGRQQWQGFLLVLCFPSHDLLPVLVFIELYSIARYLFLASPKLWRLLCLFPVMPEPGSTRLSEKLCDYKCTSWALASLFTARSMKLYNLAPSPDMN